MIKKRDITYLGDGLADSGQFTADQVIGNRIKTKKPVTVYEGFPESERTRKWPAGKLSPLVNTYVERDGDVWWSFGEEPPILYAKHDSSVLELVPDAGSKYLDKDGQGSNPFGLGLEFGEIQQYLKKAAVIGGVGLGLYLFMPLIKTGATTTAKYLAAKNKIKES